MREQREKLVFAGTAVLLGILSALQLADRYQRRPVPSARTLEAEALPRPAAVLLGSPGSAAVGERDRPGFVPPRELLPLEPVVLPDPPLPRLSVRRPAVVPSLAGAAARVYRADPDALGQLDLEDDGLPAPDEEGQDDLAPTGGSGFEGDEEEASPDALYDWVVRSSGTARVYGRILNDDPLGLAGRAGEALRFQMVSTRNGRPLGAAFDIPRVEVVEWGLARTFENAYLARSRELGQGAGAVASRKALALEMLAAWPDEPRALEFATTEARRAYEQGRGDPSAARVLAAVLTAAHDIEGAVAVYREALSGGWADAPLLADHARSMARLGLRERAAGLLEQARLLSRSAAEVPTGRGRLLLEEGRHEEALAAFRAAAQLPFSPPFEERQRAELSVLTGEALLALGRTDEARREAERALLREERHGAALRLRAAVAAAEGDLAAAAEDLAGALASDPSDATLLTNAAIVAWRQGDGPGALRLAERARDADPFRAVPATLALGFFHEDAGEPQAAREFYAEALRAEPGNPEALYRLGRNQRLEGDPESAGATLSQAMRLAGPDVLLLCELGRAALDRGVPGAATRYFREALRLEPDNGEVLWQLGSAHLLEGDLVTAAEVLTRAAAQEPGAHAALGVTAWRRGRAEEALVHFDEVGRAFAGQPDEPVARFAAEQTAAIQDNLAKRQWLDRFGRSSLQRGWTEQQWDGSPRVFLDGKSVHVEGRMEKPREDQRPGIARSVEGRGFVSAEATMGALAEGDMRYGLSLTYRQVRGVEGRLPKARLEIHVDGDGQVRVSALDNFNTLVLDAQPLEGLRVPVGETVRLGIERVDEVGGVFAFLVDERRVGEEVTLRSLRGFKGLLDLEVWGEAPPGRSAAAQIAMVRIVRVP